jgi:hypothetical protein
VMFKASLPDSEIEIGESRKRNWKAV